MLWAERAVNALLVVTAIGALISLLALARLAWGEENPLAGYTFHEAGTCTFSGEDGQSLVTHCFLMSREEDDSRYFAVFAFDGKTLLFVFREEKDGQWTAVWEKPDVPTKKREVENPETTG